MEQEAVLDNIFAENREWQAEAEVDRKRQQEEEEAEKQRQKVRETGLNSIHKTVFTDKKELSVAELKLFGERCNDIRARINGRRLLKDHIKDTQMAVCVRRATQANVLIGRIAAIREQIKVQSSAQRPREFGQAKFADLLFRTSQALEILNDSVAVLVKWQSGYEKEQQDILRAAIDAGTKKMKEENLPLSASELSTRSRPSSPAPDKQPAAKRQQSGDDQARSKDKGKAPRYGSDRGPGDSSGSQRHGRG